MNGTDPKEKTKDVPSDTDEDDVEDDDIIQEQSKRFGDQWDSTQSINTRDC